MQTILDGIMGSVLWQMAWRVLFIFVVLGGISALVSYLCFHIHIYWK